MENIGTWNRTLIVGNMANLIQDLIMWVEMEELKAQGLTDEEIYWGWVKQRVEKDTEIDQIDPQYK